MSIDRYILKKLDSCHTQHTKVNLIELFKIRIHQAARNEEARQYK